MFVPFLFPHDLEVDVEEMLTIIQEEPNFKVADYLMKEIYVILIKHQDKRIRDIFLQMTLEELRQGSDSQDRIANLMFQHETILEIDPHSILSLDTLSYYHFRRGEFKDAISQAVQCIAVNDHFPPCYLRKGFSHWQLKEYTEALNAFRKLKELFPSYPVNRYIDTILKEQLMSNKPVEKRL
tara:strand:+ start:170 stop:715 length:546 start_codon:yes stop_codon:yes gene_type:complete